MGSSFLDQNTLEVFLIKKEKKEKKKKIRRQGKHDASFSQIYIFTSSRWTEIEIVT